MPAISSSPERDSAQAAIDRHRGRFVPWIIAAFYLAFMSALIGFVFIAYGHPPNEITSNAYEKGLAYNDALDKSATQAQLGWLSTVRYDAGRVIFKLEDGRHQPVEKARVKAWFVHPALSALDRSFDLRNEGGGLYSADAPLPAQGAWTLHVTAELMDRQYQSTTQIQVD